MENPYEEKKTQRPTMLLVLCILTFIGSSWTVLSSLSRLFLNRGDVWMQKYSSILENTSSENVTDDMAAAVNSLGGEMQAMLEHGHEIAVATMVLGIISLVGAILMFQLRRAGFYLYSAAQIIMVLVVPYYVGFSWIGLSSLLLNGVISLIFIILYGVNLKYMVK